MFYPMTFGLHWDSKGTTCFSTKYDGENVTEDITRLVLITRHVLDIPTVVIHDGCIIAYHTLILNR